MPSWIEVRFLLPEEIHEHLQNETKSTPAYIAPRKKNFTLLLENGTITSYWGEEAVAIADRLLEREEVVSGIREFKGQTAYPGKVEGTVCIITSAAERHKFKQGYILVTRETTTELTSVIKQSIAIVADQASLLSHTAIVAREFKIPCIIRTHSGTKILKDGDRVEVDATNGTVRILST